MRIAQKFNQLRSTGRTALIPFIMSGDPDLDFTVELAVKLVQTGADIIELGVPFSDPLADGPTIQAAASRALERKIKIADVFHAVTRIREYTPVPLAFLVYYNCIYRYGSEKFLKECRDCGIDGLIIPDLPPEAGTSFWNDARQHGIDSILLAAPTSTPERLRVITAAATGFVYCVSVTGVTGARQHLPPHLTDFMKRVRSLTDKPLALGFGISSPSQAKAAARLTDGVIIGSALIDAIVNNGGKVEKGLALISAIRKALDEEDSRADGRSAYEIPGAGV